MSQPVRRLIDEAASRRRTLSLFDAGAGAFELLWDGEVFRTASNESTARLAVETLSGLLGDRNQIDLLIGGLGFGSSLRRALEIQQLRSVTVVESEARLLAWARSHFDLSAALDDPRTEVVAGSFDAFIHAQPESYHAVLVDVDRGPVAPVIPENRRIYSLSTLEVLARHLRSDGVLAVCLGAEDKAYRRGLGEIFSDVGSRPIVEGGVQEQVIYFARS